MADRVEIQLEDGRWEERTRENIAETELRCNMRCCGKDNKGRACHAVMVPVSKTRGSKELKGFKQKNDLKPHICGCDKDERSDCSRVSRIDMRAEGHTKEDLWNAIKDQGTRGTGGGGGYGGITGGVGGVPGGEVDEKNKPIKKVVQLPSSLQQLATVLTSLALEDYYADSYVRDLIIDSRTIDYHRGSDISDGSPMLVLAKNLHPDNRIFEADKGEIILVDAGYDAILNKEPTKCLQFRIKVYGEAKKKIFNLLKQNNRATYIAIFARLYKDSEHDKTYYLRYIDESRIGLVRLPEETE